MVFSQPQRFDAALPVLAGRAAWSRISLSDITGSWSREIPALGGVVANAQLAAAGAGVDFTARALVGQGITAEPVAVVSPAALAGVASSGVALAEALDSPRIGVLSGIKAGSSPGVALRAGASRLERLILTLVQDAGRVAAGVAVAVRPGVPGSVRMLSASPVCDWCVVLAGRFYRWDAGFLRHPVCACYMVPSDSGHAPALLTAGPRQGLRRAQRELLTTADLSERATRHGAARLMPEAIYRVADGDRTKATDLLRQHGFVF